MWPVESLMSESARRKHVRLLLETENLKICTGQSLISLATRLIVGTLSTIMQRKQLNLASTASSSASHSFCRPKPQFMDDIVLLVACPRRKPTKRWTVLRKTRREKSPLVAWKAHSDDKTHRTAPG